MAVRPAIAAGPDTRSRRAPAMALVLAASVAAAAHLAGAAGAVSSGAEQWMAWMMAAMGVACLGCLVHLCRPAHGVAVAAVHLMVMSATMAVIHAVVVLAAGASAHHHDRRVSVGDELGLDHAGAMLVLIGVELICLMVASGVNRHARRTAQ